MTKHGLRTKKNCAKPSLNFRLTNREEEHKDDTYESLINSALQNHETANREIRESATPS